MQQEVLQQDVLTADEWYKLISESFINSYEAMISNRINKKMNKINKASNEHLMKNTKYGKIFLKYGHIDDECYILQYDVKGYDHEEQCASITQKFCCKCICTRKQNDETLMTNIKFNCGRDFHIFAQICAFMLICDKFVTIRYYFNSKEHSFNPIILNHPKYDMFFSKYGHIENDCYVLCWTKLNKMDINDNICHDIINKLHCKFETYYDQTTNKTTITINCGSDYHTYELFCEKMFDLSTGFAFLAPTSDD